MAPGSVLWFARSLDSTMLAAINQLGSQQALPTGKTKRGVKQLLDYASTHKNTVLYFHASDMILTIDSDASHLVIPKARSRLAGYFCLTTQSTIHNGAVLIECETI